MINDKSRAKADKQANVHKVKKSIEKKQTNKYVYIKLNFKLD